MELHSTIEPPYFPDPEQTTVMRMGLQPLPEAEWMQVDSDLPQFYRHKVAQGERQKSRVFQALPESHGAQQEFAQLLLAHLTRFHGYTLDSGGDVLRHPAAGLTWYCRDPDLWHSSLWVAEDICILEAQGNAYRLTAASVCSPSNWDMQSKLDRNMDVIHDPVPGYHDAMSERVNRLMRGLKVDKPIQRLNWSIQPGPELFWRDDLAGHADDLEKYWRVERQTLLRLPRTGAIVFGIRVYMHSFTVMSRYPAFGEALPAILARLPQPQKDYKNLADIPLTILP